MNVLPEDRFAEADDFLAFISIYDDGIFRAGVCSNWSYVWTYSKGDKFKLEFDITDRGTDVFFEWLEV